MKVNSMSKKSYNELKDGDNVLFYIDGDFGRSMYLGTVSGEIINGYLWLHYLAGVKGEVDPIPLKNIVFVLDEEGEPATIERRPVKGFFLE